MTVFYATINDEPYAGPFGSEAEARAWGSGFFYATLKHDVTSRATVGVLEVEGGKR